MPEQLSNPFERMLDDHGTFVRGVARALVIDDPSADDVTQETWLAAIRHPPRRAGVRTWLGTVARNFSWRSRRDAARRASREERAARPEAAPGRAEPLQATMLREVIEAVLALDEPYRSTVLMRFYENLDPSDIAARLGIPAATVRTRLKRALDQLRTRFDASHGGDRRAWTVPLLPLALGSLKPAAAAAVAGGTAATAAASTYTGFTLGGILMLKKVAIGATLAIVAAVSVYVATRPHTPVDDTTPPARPYAEVADATPDAAATPQIGPAGGQGTISPKPYVPGDEDRLAGEPPAAAKAGPRALISGRVVDERGGPLANVPLSLSIVHTTAMDVAPSPTEMATERRVQAKTGPDGRFIFEGLTPGFEAYVRARPEKLCDVVRATAVTKAAPIDLGDLVATAGGSVAGTVLSPQGTAVKGCTVRAWPTESQSGAAFGVFMLRDVGNDEARSSVTNAAGQYRIDGLPEGSCSVRAGADDYPEEARAGVRVRKNDVAWDTDFKLSPGLTISGVVRGADGEPFAGAEVTASPSEIRIDDPARPTAGARSATTGADGRFSINGLRSEGWTVRARKTGFVPATQRGVTPGTEVALTLEACGMAFGHVRNAVTGAPIPSFSIKVSKEEFGMDSKLAAARVLRGAEAAKAAGVEESPNLFAVVDLPDTPVKLEVRAEDFAELQVGSVRAAPGAKIEIAAPMQPQALVRGFVVDTAGKPVEGAKVTAETPKAVDSEGPQPTGRAVRVKRRVARSESAAPIEEPMVTRSGETGPDGSFAIKGLPSGKYQLRASHRAFANATPVDLTIKPGETVDGMKLVVKLGGTLAGHALDADGKKLPGARIRIQPKSGPKDGMAMLLGDGGREPVISDSEGAYEITGLEAGEYYASLADSPVDGQVRFAVAVDDETQPEGTLVTIEAGRTTRKDLQQKPRASVSGIVKEGGKPAAGVRVSLSVEGVPVIFGMPSTKTDEQGAFVIDNVAPGEYNALFDPPGAPEPIRRPVTLAPRSEARLVVDLPTGAIEGRVVDLTTGKPVADVTVTAAAEKEQEGAGGPGGGAVMVAAISSSDGGGDIQTFSFGAPSQPVKTDADGRYRLSYVEAGKHKVSIRGAGIMPQSRKGVVVDEGKTTKEIDFGAEKGASLLVTVDPAGREVGGVFVFLEPQGGEDNRDVKNGTTKAPIKFTGLKPGRYHVRADALGNDLEGSTDVEVVAGQETKATIRLAEK